MATPSREAWDKALWTRLENAAAFDNLTLEEMSRLPDQQILRTPNLGARSLRLLRSAYPRQPRPAAMSDKTAMIEMLKDMIVQCEATIRLLKASDP